jgi:hypothetical protein
VLCCVIGLCSGDFYILGLFEFIFVGTVIIVGQIGVGYVGQGLSMNSLGVVPLGATIFGQGIVFY